MLCDYKEADTQTFVHVRHTISEGHTTLMVNADASHILMIAIVVAQVLNDTGLEEQWNAFDQEQTCDEIQYMM